MNKISTKNHGIRYQFLRIGAEIWRLALFFIPLDTKIIEKGTKIKTFQHQQAREGRKGRFMTENEKKLIQAKRRLEEAQARDRVKQRKARTRRLIQEGAVLEKALPQTVSMDLNELETYLHELTN